MAGGYYKASGEFVEGHLHGGDSGMATSAINHEVDEAVTRCRNGASAKQEMMLFYKRYPHLKQSRWAEGEHPILPLVNEYVIEVFGLDR